MHLQIKTQSLPTRCDICHKADQFEPENNNCSRCHSVLKQTSKVTSLRLEPCSFAYGVARGLFDIGIAKLARYFRPTEPATEGQSLDPDGITAHLALIVIVIIKYFLFFLAAFAFIYLCLFLNLMALTYKFHLLIVKLIDYCVGHNGD